MEYLKERRQWLADVFAGKNPFENKEKKYSEAQESREKTDNLNINVLTTWSTLLRYAESYKILPKIHNQDNLSSAPFNEKLLDVSLAKSVRDLMLSLNIDRYTAQEEILKAWAKSKNPKHSVVATVRFFRDFQESSLLECEECGSSNDFGWDVCVKCGAKNL